MKPMITYSFITICVLLILLSFNQEVLLMDEVVLRGIGFGALVIGFLVFGLVSFVTANIKLYSKKRDELTKYNWDKVKITPIPYSTVWRTGYAIRISNNKTFDIDKLNVSLFSVEIDKTPRPKPNRAYYFQSIDYEEHSFSHLNDDGVKSEKEKDYAITELLTARGKTTCKLFTTQNEDDYIGYFFRSKSGKAIKDRNIIITLSIKGSIQVENEVYFLPVLYKKYQIMSDGKIIER